MIPLLRRWFRHGGVLLSEAGPREAAALSALHAKSFHRGWSEAEFERLLLDRSVLTDRASFGYKIVGFIMTRRAADQADILTVAVADARRRRGLAGQLLALHLRKLAGLGVRRVFLEVDESNRAARRLYQRAGFRAVGRRAEYYQRSAGGRAVALVLRRDLV